MQKSLENHLAAIRSGTVTRTNVIGIRKAINAAERRAGGWSVPRTAPDLRQTEKLEDAIFTLRPTVTGELHDTGLKALRNPRYAKRFDSDQRMIIEARHVRFDLVRFDRIGRRGEYAVPVYRITSFHGAFNFRIIPWQSGGNGPEIVA